MSPLIVMSSRSSRSVFISCVLPKPTSRNFKRQFGDAKVFVSVSTTLSFRRPALFAKAQGDQYQTNQGTLTVYPIRHASTVFRWKDVTLYADPSWDSALYNAYNKPDVIVITHFHGDHFSPSTLQAIVKPTTKIFAPANVVKKMPESLKKLSQVMVNGDIASVKGLTIEAIPMYNLTKKRLKRHIKGRDNGYVVSFGDKRIYLSGDTEDIPEMRQLKNIDIAFVCMNLPFTMDVEHAADAVIEFKPKIVYPYHYRNKDKTLSDTKLFAKLVRAQGHSQVVLRDWYAK